MSPDLVLTVLMALLFATSAMGALVGIYGLRRLERLADIEADAGPSETPAPRVSVVVAARNEEEHLQETLESLLAQDHQNLEVVVVNDRSSDRTGAIAEAAAARDGRVKVIHIDILPEGWFGKNHAVWRGMKQVAGDIALLTDGDVSFSPDSVARAVLHFERQRLGHLAGLVKYEVPGIATKATVIALGFFFVAAGRAWKVRDTKSPVFLGVGPFNLVRVSSYFAAGGHKAIRLDPNEDLMIGRLIKRTGFRSDVVRASPQVRFRWYSSLGGLVRGLEKNAFGATDFRVGSVLLQTVAMLAATVLPFLLLPVCLWLYGMDWPTVLAFGAVGILWLCGVAAAKDQREPSPIGLCLPVGTVILVYAMWRSTVVNIARGATWGGSLVPLSELRAHRREMLARSNGVS